MDVLNSALAGLGPWGLVAGAFLTIVAQRLQARLNSKTPVPVPVPVTPAPTPVPPPSVPVLSNRPILNLLLHSLLTLVQGQAQATGKPVEEVLADHVAAIQANSVTPAGK